MARGVAAITGNNVSIKQLSSSKYSARTELDSHADMCCVGKNTHILYMWPNKNVWVTPFLRNLGVVESAPIVSALIAYDDPSLVHPYFLSLIKLCILIHLNITSYVLCNYDTMGSLLMTAQNMSQESQQWMITASSVLKMRI